MSQVWRPDIQALRGLAVGLVVLYHAKIAGLPGGYLGVDIFFVLSGYLVTRLVMEDIVEDRFSLATFYWRRARRLLPAAFVTIGVCIAAAPWLLSPSERADFYKSAIFALGFTANVGLWLQVGYFQTFAELKPLLHFWSLAVEEQYYMFLPLALLLLLRRNAALWMAAVTVMSALACFVLLTWKPGFTFYWLPTRAWELGMGSILALTQVRWLSFLEGRSLAATRGIRAIACVAIIAVVARPFSPLHPGGDALVVCLATALLIAVGIPRVNTLLLGKCFCRLGDISYSLYLVHWPVFALYANANVANFTPWQVRVALIFLSLILAVVMYRFVEKPFRVSHSTARNAWRDFAVLGLVAVTLAAICALLLDTSANKNDLSARLRGNVGLAEQCARPESTPSDADACATSQHPEVVLWGDSFAMHWASALASQGVSLRQLTRSTCAPILDWAVQGGEFSAVWGESCIAFNAATFKTIAASSAHTVVLSSPWTYLVGPTLQRGANGSFERTEGTPERIAQAVDETVRKLRALGKRVVVLAPPPGGLFDRGRCIARAQERLITFGASVDCTVPVEKQAAEYQKMKATLDQISSRAHVEVVEFFDELCGTGTCITRYDDVIIYRDSGHLSYEGAAWLVKRSNLVRKIESQSR